MMINSQDFAYMLCGKEIKILPKDEVDILRPINIQKRPAGRAILLLHGFTSSPAAYREIIPRLTMYDAILCPVLPGHAENIDVFAKTNSQKWLNCAESAFVGLRQQYRQVDVMGLSLGGLLALKVAEKHPINHLFLLAPALKLHRWTRTLLYLAKFLRFMGLKKLPSKGGDLYCQDFYELTYRKIPLPVAIQLLSLVANNKFVAPDCATDLLVGKHDSVVDSEAVVNLFSGLKNINIHWLQNSAHVLPLDGDIEKILSVVQSVYAEG